jgi:hypothetical protein
MKIWKIGAGILLVTVAVHAEVRTWEDLKGNRYEAEFVRELFDKVTLRTTDGRELRFGLEELSEHDQKYVRVMVPPELALEFRRAPLSPPPPRGDWDTYAREEMRVVSGEAEIRKKSKREFTSGLRAELYLIAKEVDGKNYILLSRTESSFLLGDHNEGVHTFRPRNFQMRRYKEYNDKQERGEEYAGYLLVVLDAKGRLVTARSDLGEWMTAPAVIENLRDLNVRGAASLRSRHFDQTGKKVLPTRPLPGAPHN